MNYLVVCVSKRKNCPPIYLLHKSKAVAIKVAEEILTMKGTRKVIVQNNGKTIFENEK